MLAWRRDRRTCVHQRRLIVAVVGLAALFNCRANAVAGSVDSKTLSERHAQVVKMSTVERERLQRNLAEFQKLSPEKQEQYRQLNAQLEENRKTGGQLNSLMQTYSAWLQTLTPTQREELRQATDSAQKLSLVQKFKEEQMRDHSMNDLEEFNPWGPRPHRESLSVPELTSVMKVLASELPEEDQQHLGKVNRVEQHVEVLKKSIQHAENPREWPSEALQGKMMGELPPHFRNSVKRSPRPPREALVLLIVSSIHNRTMDELRSKLPPMSELDKLHDELDEKQRRALDQRRPELRRFELAMLYFKKHSDKSVVRMLETGKLLYTMIERIGITPPPRPLFPGDGPPPWPPGGPGFGPDRGPDDRPRPGGTRFEPGNRPDGDRPPPERADPPPPRRGPPGNRRDPE